MNKITLKAGAYPRKSINLKELPLKWAYYKPEKFHKIKSQRSALGTHQCRLSNQLSV